MTDQWAPAVLRGAGLADLRELAAALLAFTVVTIGVAVFRFRTTSA